MNVLDLFSGIGGFSLGLERAGMKTVAFCEIDPEAQKVLHKHWPLVPIFSDVSKLTAKDLNEPIDIIVGGFPCQDISLAGKGAGLAGERSGLWFEFHRLIKEAKPKWVIAENVSALRSRGLDQVLRSLAEIGYDAEWHCIPASAVGAPHRRDRIWIVAYPQGSGDRRIPRDLQEANEQQEEERPQERLWKSDNASESSGGVLANSSIKGLERQRTRTFSTKPKESMLTGSGCVVRSIHQANFWEVEPNVGRVAHGVSGRVDRLKQLGNAVVPQIPELIGRAIMAVNDNEEST